MDRVTFTQRRNTKREVKKMHRGRGVGANEDDIKKARATAIV
jgi:hypothetical protein